MKEYPWHAYYPKGTPREIEPLTHASVPELLSEAFRKYSDKVAFENMGVKMTFGELDVLSNAFAAYLQKKLDLKKGDRIALQMPNLLQFPVALIGSLKAGLTVVNTNPLYTPREMEYQFNDANVSAIVIVENFAHNLQSIQAKISVPADRIIVTRMGDMLGGLKGMLVNFVVKRVKKLIPDYQLPGTLAFKRVLSEGAGLTWQPPALEREDLAFLQYTGGTTGISKGAQLSHRNILAHNAMVTHWFKPWMRPDGEDVVVTAIPMYHSFALTVNGILMMSQGVMNVLITNPRDIPGFVRELSKHRFTILTGVNTLFNALMSNPDFYKLDFSRLKGAVGGAMAVQDVVADRWEAMTKTALVEGYGLSETSPVLTCNPLDGTHRRGTIGIPVPSTELMLFDDDGKEVPLGQPGEICARGPQVMRGYWQKDNEGVFFDGEWFRTGDIGVMDEKGFFKIVDRKKDMIKVSGFNVYPNEIENVIAGHPKVFEVAAIGVSDLKSGETIKAFVVKKDQSLSEEELKKYCQENMTAYKVPRHFEFRAELPKSNVGKIMRRVLKEQEGAKAK